MEKSKEERKVESAVKARKRTSRAYAELSMKNFANCLERLKLLFLNNSLEG